MNIDSAREVRSARVIEPVIVREPGVFVGDCNEVPRTNMIEAGLTFLLRSENLFHTRDFFDERPDVIEDGGVVDINVSDLVIGDGKGATGAGIEQLESQFFANRDPVFLTKQAIEVEGIVHRRDAIFGDDQWGDSARLK